MGDGPSHVVDAELKVNGVKNIRIAGIYLSILFSSHYFFGCRYFISLYIDASVIPHIPNGNVHATVLVVAYKAAEMIIETFFGKGNQQR